ncbi:MAG: amidohydrolase family protein [Planctomycetota bacterium]|nr:amidohydrolase family protein [Planctomycetota bacterium]
MIRIPLTIGCWTLIFSVGLQVATSQGTDVVTTGPHGQTNGLTEATIRWDCFEHARVVVRPGTVIENATVILRDGWIDAVGVGIPAPTGATLHDATGKTIYAGLIDIAIPVSTAAAASQAASTPGAHWNPRVTPQVRAALAAPLDAAVKKELRALGFTAAFVRPDSGMFRGTSALQLLDETSTRSWKVDRESGSSIALEVGEFEWGPDADAKMRTISFPGSQMGAVALIRQTLSDAAWGMTANALWQSNPQGDTPPDVDAALRALTPLVKKESTAWLHTKNEQQLLRLARLMNEAGVKAAVIGSGLEFRRIGEVSATGLDIVIPLTFPKVPEVADPREAEQVSLGELKSWALAPANAALLRRAGVDIALTSAGLENRSQFAERVRMAQEAGLSEDDTLAALTTEPARMASIDDIVGTVEAGKMANLIVTDGGNLFGPKTKIREVWIAGERHLVNPEPTLGLDGACVAQLPSGDSRDCTIDASASTISFTLPLPEEDPAVVAEGAVVPVKKNPKKIAATQVKVNGSRISFVVAAEALGLPESQAAASSLVRCAGSVDGGVLYVTGLTIGGSPVSFQVSKAVDDKAATTTDEEKKDKPLLAIDPAMVPLTTPMGAFGREASPLAQSVVFRGATIWTSGPLGILEDADLFVSNGKVVAVGCDLVTPGATEVDATGKHITAGMVDCHSHTGIDGGVNEFTQACSAEVRVGDVIDPDDINWYRQLAGGLTAANQLHGSANPIGGQNSVVKARWGLSSDAFMCDGAKPGMKWALGENVVRPERRYPDTRMGVETFLRDRLTAARHYLEAMDAWRANSGARSSTDIAPRRDLELEALGQILKGERIVHCHSYRQDEILMLLRLAEEFHFKIGTLQHVLEGYKIAEAIAEHGAGASCFSDWWAYKIEVMDAIPYAGAMMHDVGVLVSFNSDSNEMARRLNLEAAKAVRYGGIDPSEALKFTTVNPAIQLGIGDRTGSLEPGKDADLVVWSGDPLSNFSKCESTWIDGACYFDLASDLAMRARDASLRTTLIAAAISSSSSGGPVKDGASTDRPRRGRRGGDSAPTGAPTLLSRLLDESDHIPLEAWRSGFGPNEMMPTQCGCQ